MGAERLQRSRARQPQSRRAATMELKTVLVERQGELAVVRLNRPHRLNAIDPQMHRDLQAACAALAEETNIRVVVLTGAGRAFSSGADVKERRDDPRADYPTRRRALAAGSRTCAALEALPQVTIAAVNGLAIGGGVVLAVTCDLRLAAESAWFWIPEVSFGVPLTWGALPRLVRLIGPARTLELVATGDRFSAQQALTWGMVNHVVPDGELWERTLELARKLLANPAMPVAATKATLRALGRASELGDVAYADPDLLALGDFRPYRMPTEDQ